MTAALEPAAPGGDAFVDAVVGLDQLCRWLGPVVDAAAGGGAGEASDAAVGDDLLDAVLGLVSLRTTLALVLAALDSEPPDVPDGPAAGWSRDLLR
jgi:uncharacterized membrane protein